LIDPDAPCKATIGGKLPSADLNGLAAAAPTFRQHIDKPIIALAKLSVRKTEKDEQTGEYTVKLGIDVIEPIAGDGGAHLAELLANTTAVRTGVLEIDGFTAAFGTVTHADPETGELR
jgi:hypothetical protein